MKQLWVLAVRKGNLGHISQGTVKARNASSLVDTYETPSGVMSPLLGFPSKERR